MNKFLILILSLCITASAYADDIDLSEPKLIEPEVQEDLQSTEELSSETHDVMNSEELIKKLDEENALNGEKKPELEIIHRVERRIIPMPNCDDKVLYEKTKAFIDEYFNKLGNLGTLYRRRHYFIVHSLDKFKEEDIASYKTVETQLVANAIANAEVNFSLKDDNLRLCKNTSQNKYTKDIYLLIFPKDDGYIVQLLNVMERQEREGLDISFFYKDDSLTSAK